MKTHKLPPVVPTQATPSQILGNRYDAFLGFIKARSKGGFSQPADQAAFFAECVTDLEAAGFIADGLNSRGDILWRTRLQSPVDLMFHDDQTYGGVPPLRDLRQMSAKECRALAKKTGWSI